MTPALFNPRARSLPRGNILVLGSLAASIPLSRFPHLRATLWLALPVLFGALGTVDTLRCMRPRWSFYHGGVLLCVYMDLMALTLMLLFLLCPYFF